MQASNIPRNKSAQSNWEAQPYTPPLTRHDSLVLSVTAQKMQSPYESDLLKDSYQYINYNLTERTNGVRDSCEKGSGLSCLGQRLQILQGKIRSIKTQRVSTESEGNRQEIDIYDIPEFDKENHGCLGNSKIAVEQRMGNVINRSGFFMKKNKKCDDSKLVHENHEHLKTQKNSVPQKSVNKSEKSSRHNSILRYIARCSKQNNGKFSSSFILNRTYGTPKNRSINKNYSMISDREVGTLKSRISQLQRKANKSEQSRSLCSKRLSETRHNLSISKLQNKRQCKLVQQLSKKLKKSENIRHKQKQTILKQKREIEELKRMVKEVQKQVPLKNQ